MAVLKVLVIDDEPGIRSGVSRILNNFHVTYPFMDEDYTFEVAEAASGAIVTVQPYAIQMDVSINLDIRAEAIIMADPDDMEIVFNNLISNAVKYNKIGGKAEITIDSSDSEAILIFSDTGIGITKNDTENLFAEFVRIKNEKTRNISGSGLGLSIVKKVVNDIIEFGEVQRAFLGVNAQEVDNKVAKENNLEVPIIITEWLEDNA